MNCTLLRTLLLTSLLITACSSKKSDGTRAIAREDKGSHYRKVEQLSDEEFESLASLKEGDVLTTGEIFLEKIQLTEGLAHLVLNQRKIVMTSKGNMISLSSDEAFQWEGVNGRWSLTFSNGQQIILN